MIAAIFSSWPGPDRRIEQRAFEGPDQRVAGRDEGPPRPPEPPFGHGAWKASWMRQWTAPQTVIVLVSFIGFTAVAHYRVGEVEKEVAKTKVEIAEIDAKTKVTLEAMRIEMANTYQRRDELLAKLETIAVKLEAIRDEQRAAIRSVGRGGQP